MATEFNLGVKFGVRYLGDYHFKSQTRLAPTLSEMITEPCNWLTIFKAWLMDDICSNLKSAAKCNPRYQQNISN